MVLNNNQNRDITNNIVNDFGLNITHDIIPSQVNPTIQPVREVYDKVSDVVKRSEAINATAGTIYTTPTDKDFYLCSAQLSLIKDATATSTATSLRVTIGGVVVQVLTIVGLTLTAQSANISQSFSAPIKIDRNTSITINNATNVGNVSAGGVIVGYIKNNKDNTGS